MTLTDEDLRRIEFVLKNRFEKSQDALDIGKPTAVGVMPTSTKVDGTNDDALSWLRPFLVQ